MTIGSGDEKAEEKQEVPEKHGRLPAPEKEALGQHSQGNGSAEPRRTRPRIPPKTGL